MNAEKANISGLEDVIDGIEEIKSEELRMKNDDVWYDLSGRRIMKAQKGICIVNGRKVVK